MKVTKEEAARHRAALIEAAGRLFRERGFEGVSLAEISKAAGLTHGAFYGHFTSKEDLAAQACGQVLDNVAANWRRVCEAEGPRALGTIASAYLSSRHRDNPGEGCPFATLGQDIARQEAPVRGAVTRGLRGILAILGPLFPGKTEAARKQKALAAYASLVGAMVLARSVEDPHLSEEILRSVAASLPLSPE
ncbi:TetR/AcrR family transcriptional regulator [Stigmatella aurantiaca]|uniref:Transcriptional regulator, TetR family n=1 Tax=Stigmatella aurantiaca (strain DW4/3-1) TaxID=378806 RepID=Q09DY5_STIAD|nr:TetR/AcrR family transcriptional regulator [Stigmatella aurantiaca]ADO75176.1 Transcriptional regulator, TetR family [Stigmatella aurantiaca DW4/3-1]EAU69911.1 transcriptional regulator, TetR family [Stigmatella aurantiaca DW4/3-1]